MTENDIKKADTVYCSFVSIHYIVCECGETFPTEDELKFHLETEHPQEIKKKDFKCSLCDLVYTTQEECTAHHQEAHTTKMVLVRPPSPPKLKFILQPIKKKEPDQDIIVTSGKHPGTRKKPPNKNIKTKVCEVCGKKYTSNAALRYHQRMHTGERPYQCEYCEKAFTMPLFLQIHTRIHTGEKPYQCQNCPKAFGNKAALVRHDRVHTGVKPYHCPHCHKAFTQSNSMKLHVHTVHLKLPTPYKRKRGEKIVKQEMQDWCVVKDEVHDTSALCDGETRAEDGSVYYDDDDDQQIVYEVVYEQE